MTDNPYQSPGTESNPEPRRNSKTVTTMAGVALTLFGVLLFLMLLLRMA